MLNRIFGEKEVMIRSIGLAGTAGFVGNYVGARVDSSIAQGSNGITLRNSPFKRVMLQ